MPIPFITPFSRLAVLLLLAAVSSARGQSSADIDKAARIYGALPLAEDVRLSPDGNSLSLIAGLKGRRTLAIWHLDGGKPTLLTSGTVEPRWLAWKTSDRLLASVYFGEFKNYMSAAQVTRMLTLSSDGSDDRLVDFSKLTGFWGASEQFQDQVVSFLPRDPDHILVRASSRHSILATVDIRTGRTDPIGNWDSSIIALLVDKDGAVRLTEISEYGENRFYLRTEEGKWVRIGDLIDLEKEPIDAIAFSGDDKDVVYFSVGREDKTAEIRAFNLRDAKWGETVASEAGEAAYPISYKNELIGYSFGDSRLFYLDVHLQKLVESVKKALPGHWVAFVDRSDDGKRFLFHAIAAAEGDSYWLLDLRGPSPQLRPLFQNYDDLTSDQVAPTRAINYAARDGLNIPGWLTLPRDYRSGPIPFVVLPHGGPTAHDTGEFDYLPEFFAALGYGVLQPQFRGSTGYGLALRKAGYGQWGRKMQDDIADGARWLMEQGYADPSRIAIVGFSYGGYAALMGGIRDPDLFRCVVAGAPVADLAQYVDDIGYTAGGRTSIPWVKGPEVSLNQISPVKRAREMKAPVLLVHGRLDFTVPVVHSEAMERELKFYDHPVTAVYFAEADHYFGHEADRVAMLRAVGKFLVDNLGAVPPPAATSSSIHAVQ